MNHHRWHITVTNPKPGKGNHSTDGISTENSRLWEPCNWPYVQTWCNCRKCHPAERVYHTVTVTVTVSVNLFKCPKNKRPCGLPLDIWHSRLHLELPYMKNVLAHGTPPRSGVVTGSLIRFLNILGRQILRCPPRNAPLGCAYLWEMQSEGIMMATAIWSRATLHANFTNDSSNQKPLPHLAAFTEYVTLL